MRTNAAPLKTSCAAPASSASEMQPLLAEQTSRPDAAMAGVIAPQIVDYQTLLDALRSRAIQQQVALSAPENAALAGVPDQYLGKVLGTRPVRRLGPSSLGAVLGLLGCRLVLVVDKEAMRKYGSRVKRHNPNLVRSATEPQLAERHAQRMGRKGARSRWSKTTPEERSEVARNLNRLRWSKPKIVEMKRAAS
jgi:hypothetical protein